ncbi:hypothetical protein PG997_005920 [Apiospora hydei]|uniref:Uncharacterized protein n=1 Tax=Apiospora hydei TaxID=1337664 RepID=A0ABR1WRB8_9PEZI
MIPPSFGTCPRAVQLRLLYALSELRIALYDVRKAYTSAGIRTVGCKTCNFFLGLGLRGHGTSAAQDANDHANPDRKDGPLERGFKPNLPQQPGHPAWIYKATETASTAR